MKIAVTGYASLDYVVRLDSAALPDRTATILSRPEEWPRLGGSPAYVCAALVAGGVGEATPVSWIGEDAAGAQYHEELRRRGLATEAVRTRAGRTPVCWLAYQPDGGCLCFYHPGLTPPIGLDDTQRAIVSAADALAVTVGPPKATREALDCARADAKFVWVVKADPRATPPELAAALAARADIVVHSRAEADFVEAACAGGVTRRAFVRIETRGAKGVAIFQDTAEILVPAKFLEVEDTTGAGDSWIGGFLAAHLAHGATLPEAAMAGAETVRAMLAARHQSEEQA